MRIYALILVASAIINSSLCDVKSNVRGNLKSTTKTSTNDQQLKLPNLNDCKDSK